MRVGVVVGHRCLRPGVACRGSLMRFRSAAYNWESDVRLLSRFRANRSGKGLRVSCYG